MMVCVTLICFGISFAQHSNNEAIKIEKELLATAKKYGDPAVSLNSIYRLITLEGDNSTYKDSLALIYFSGRKYAQCFMVANDVLKRSPKHEGMLEIKAISLEAIGALDKSLEAYQDLFAITKNNYHSYNIAKLQYNMKKYEEAYTTIQTTEKLNDSGKIKVTYNINQNHQQQVELLAAIAYLKGIICLELDKKTEAKQSLEKAIKVQPDFIFAKEQLEKL